MVMGLPDSSCFFAMISTSKLMFILTSLAEAADLFAQDKLCCPFLLVLYQYAAIIATWPLSELPTLLGKGLTLPPSTTAPTLEADLFLLQLYRGSLRCRWWLDLICELI
jgi:hypothetical protein